MIADFIQNTIVLLQSPTSDFEDFSGILVCDDEAILETFEAIPFAGKWTFICLTAFNGTEFTQRYDLAVLIFTENLADTLHSNQPMYNFAVQRCRDIFAEHTLIFAPNSQDYIAFGFSKVSGEKVAVDKENQLVGWQFNLFDYKQLPDWFNSRFWANPENWNKFRW